MKVPKWLQMMARNTFRVGHNQPEFGAQYNLYLFDIIVCYLVWVKIMPADNDDS